jgi:hypothetical protein
LCLLNKTGRSLQRCGLGSTPASLAMEETMVVEGADTVGQGEVVSTGILQDNPLLFGSDVSITFSVS